MVEGDQKQNSILSRMITVNSVAINSDRKNILKMWKQSCRYGHVNSSLH